MKTEEFRDMMDFCEDTFYVYRGKDVYRLIKLLTRRGIIRDQLN